MPERLIGFDARASSAGVDAWSPERRARYLLRDAGRPLSVDDSVWPSVLDERHDPTARTGALGLWDDLSRLRSALVGRSPETWWTVAFTVRLDLMRAEDLPLWQDGSPRLPAVTPPTVEPAWRRLGFDVADQWLLSGLANCGYDDAEWRDYPARFGAALNEHHLFARAEDADHFRSDADLRVSEHAPFFVIGLYLVDGAPTAKGAESS